MMPFAVLALLPVLVSAVRITDESKTRAECGEEVARQEDGVENYFNGLRGKYGLAEPRKDGNINTAHCTKKDVCLLMRQLDMDFYSRARAGRLTRMDFTASLHESWIDTGTCEGQFAAGRGYSMRTVTEAKCRSMENNTFPDPSKSGAVLSVRKFEVVSNPKYPPGCVKMIFGHKTKTLVLKYNTAQSSVEPDVRYKDNGKVRRSAVYCEQDRSLSQSGAAYYSPYKMKPSMVAGGMEAMSTSCSFGRMGELARAGQTNSVCGQIIAQPDTVRQKMILLDTIANKWCPDVWTNSMDAGNVCDVPRVMSWTHEWDAAKNGEVVADLGEEDANAANLKGPKKTAEDASYPMDANSRPIKSALTETSCEAFDDEDLKTILEASPESPPDFFRDATV